jgi:uncharacterized protein YjiK
MRTAGNTKNRASAGRNLALVIIATLAAFMGSRSSGVSAAGTTPIFISELHPSGSGNGTYGADWFEVTNVGFTTVSIAGWRMDDNSNAFASAVALRGVTSIPPGKSAIFFEGDATGATDATITASFLMAWFGSTTPPAGFLIGAYGGAGVGLGTGGDSVNLFDASGTRITGSSFGAAPTTTPLPTFDNTPGAASTTLPLPTVSTLSATGFNGAIVSANGLEIGSPGTKVNSSPLTLVDLSTYVRVGRFDLPEPTRTTAPANSVLAQEVSGVTYNWDTDTLFVVGDMGTSVVQVSKTGQLIDSMTLAQGTSPQGTDFFDPEGITYIGSGQFVMTEERDRQVVRFTYAPGTTLNRSGAQTVKLGTFVPNIGLEGLTFDPTTNGFIIVKEIDPLGIFQTGIDFTAGTATNGSATTENSTNLFNPALAGLLDFADVFALSNLRSLSGADSSRLLLLSHESGKVLNISRTGVIANALTIVSDPGNPLSVPAQQHEGLTMDGNGILYIVSENGGGDFDHPQLWVYAPSTVPNKAPTALALTNQTNTLVENTTTVARIKMADVVVTDDGLGTNNLTVTGADASAFEVDSNGLYIKAGTTLDFETKASYSVTLAVDDPTIGATPDATATYSLTLIDIVNENPSSPIIFISEVAAWSSGNSPVAADWIEITNNGNSAVTLTGWKIDDDSSSFTSAVTLNGITSIAPGESVIFLETADLAATRTSFLNTWFGASPPAGLQIGSYTGSGVGLGTGGDAVNLYDSGGTRQARVTFGASPASAPYATFNNAAALNNAVITQLSVVGANGGFVAVNDANEIGSPGTVGRLIISEVAPWGSGNSPGAVDWFEVTNTRATAVDITGWKVDDSSESFAAAVPISGITSIAPGQSVIFMETDSVATARATFLNTWFGTNPPSGLQVGGYSGGGVGLSTGGDAVVLYNSTGVLQAKVVFGASPAGPSFPTFDNGAGLNNVTISQLSAAGVRGAFVAANDNNEIGSPGAIAPPTVALDRTSLNFTATNSSTAFVEQTPNQAVRLLVSGGAPVTWTATPSQPWITVTPTSGTGAATLTIGVVFNGSLPMAGSSNGSIAIAVSGASNAAGPIGVALTTKAIGTAEAPFGVIDTPANNATGISGSIAITGWALDDVGVSKVEIVRDPVAGEGSAPIFIGTAVLVEGARPDVAALYSTFPRFTQAGWGYLMLTNGLPNQGNGTFRISAIATDVDGKTTTLGTKAITVDNASSTKPFGAIDTPGQGEVVSGANYPNFGWVLVREPAKANPPDGGTVTAFIDGVAIGAPGSWGARPDLTAAFPPATYPAVARALGVIGVNTTTLANGVHTIAWTVTATNGQQDGIGGRFFTVANSGLLAGGGSGQVGDGTPSPAGGDTASLRLAAPPMMVPDGAQAGVPLAATVDAAPPSGLTIDGRRGFDLAAPLRKYAVGDDGRVTIHAEELDRIELQLGGPGYTGYTRIGGKLGPLPIGSHLDEATGTFTWGAGVGFVGDYDLVFVPWSNGRAVERSEVRVTLIARSRGAR